MCIRNRVEFVMVKRRILITTGTRADYGLLRPILENVKNSKRLELYLVVAGMHLSKKYGLTINDIKKDGFKIYAKINFLSKNDSLLSTTNELGNGIMKFAKIMQRIKPDINIILGDRDEMLASALAASHMNIPNAHIHGGDRSGGIDEYNRHAITKISNIHFAATQKSKQRIIKMGENAKNVFFTGSPGVDDIFRNRIATKNDLKKKYSLDITGNEIILLYHPVTTEIEKTKEDIKNILNAIKQFRMPIIAIHPNSDAGNKKIFNAMNSFARTNSLVRVFPSIPRADYLGLLKNCGILVGNSSSGIIEASYFDIPVVNIGLRQVNRESGKYILNVNKPTQNSIRQAIFKAIKMKKQKVMRDFSYGTGSASNKITHILETISLNKELIQKQIQY